MVPAELLMPCDEVTLVGSTEAEENWPVVMPPIVLSARLGYEIDAVLLRLGAIQLRKSDAQQNLLLDRAGATSRLLTTVLAKVAESADRAVRDFLARDHAVQGQRIARAVGCRSVSLGYVSCRICRSDSRFSSTVTL